MADWHETPELERVGYCGLDRGRSWLSLTAAEVEQQTGKMTTRPFSGDRRVGTVAREDDSDELGGRSGKTRAQSVVDWQAQLLRNV